MFLSKSKFTRIHNNFIKINVSHYHNHQYKTRKHHKKPTQFMINLKETHDPEDALSLFHDYNDSGFKHDYSSYSSLIYKLARSHDFDGVDRVLHYLQESGIRCQEKVFVALFQHFGKAQLIDKAIDLFEMMGRFNCGRSLFSFNGLINVLVDNDRLFDADRLIDRSREMGLRLNAVSFNILIKGSLKKGEWIEACKVFDEMLEREVEPSVVTYNSLIGYLCRNGDLDKGLGLFDEMVKKGKYPNAVTYALLMEGLCLKGEYEEARKLMFDMEYKGCKPRLVNFGVLMNDLVNRGRVEDAKGLLLEMRKRHFKPDVVIYNILISYLSKEGRMTEAYKILIEMQVRGCEANAATYRMLADGFCRIRDYEGGLKVVNAMLASRHFPRTETFGCLVVGLLNSGNDDGACFVLEEMEKRGMRLDLDVWETIVRNSCTGDSNAGKLITDLMAATVD